MIPASRDDTDADKAYLVVQFYRENLLPEESGALY